MAQVEILPPLLGDDEAVRAAMRQCVFAEISGERVVFDFRDRESADLFYTAVSRMMQGVDARAAFVEFAVLRCGRE